MASLSAASAKWSFTRPDPPDSCSQYFRTDLRKIASQQPPEFYLPWQDNMYLAYPSLDRPDWPAFVAHVKQLNEKAEINTRYKIVYIMRRAHKASGDTTTPDPSIDDKGEQECVQLAKNLDRAIRTTRLEPPDVIVTSPLARTLETTQRGVAPLFPSIPIIVLEDLRETVDGTKKNERHKKEWIEQKFAAFNTENVDPNDRLGSTYARSVEKYEDLWQRVKGVFVYIFENFEKALVVALMSHCYVEQTIQREITGCDVREEERKDKVEFRVGHTGAYAIVVKGVRK